MKDCGGCPGFLAQWDDIQQQAERVRQEEKKDSNSRIARELRVALLVRLRAFVPLVYAVPSDDGGTVLPLENQIVGFEITDTSSEITDNNDDETA
jgi:uncharacterized membrane protein